RELLAMAGLHFAVRPAEIDEAVAPGEAPLAYVARVARRKLAAALPSSDTGLGLSADARVVAGDTILGKPPGDPQAHAILEQLVGRPHRVMTTVALGRAQVGVLEDVTVTTLVRFRAATAEELGRYIATGEGRDKAGAYAIQGIGAGLVSGIEGSYTNVV